MQVESSQGCSAHASVSFMVPALHAMPLLDDGDKLRVLKRLPPPQVTGQELHSLQLPMEQSCGGVKQPFGDSSFAPGLQGSISFRASSLQARPLPELYCSTILFRSRMP
jgi:hypothetical protein